ncbi:low temperature requirement protein A [Nocardia higoensis]|uniref:low temperature requirement protein A n=1 Tax=Nocardia higoensis TaxID=228599 RepID=UPI00030D15B4|nr:low temperature requirement protein A [Nocardia higoensis]
MTDTEEPNALARGIAHRMVPMIGRDPQEQGRAASPLELLVDLTFVVAVGTAASQLAEMVAHGHIGPAVPAFVLAMFAIVLAWLSFSWFASAFDTDDWLYRVLTMVQMCGVVVFALGLPPMFHSLDGGDRLELRLMVIGYVVMRVAMVLQWGRVARQTSAYQRVATANIRWITIVQIGWVLVGFVPMPIPAAVAVVIGLGTLEVCLPRLAQGLATGTPWHPHHMAERYALFAIIALGEGVVGTVASSSGLLGGENGLQWSTDTIAVVVAGTGLTFGMWWVYFMTPFGEMLALRRDRGYLFGFGHIPLFIGIAAAGAGLHVAGLYLEHHSELDEVAVVLCLAVPVGLYVSMVYLLHTALMAAVDPFHLLLLGLTLGVLALAAVLSALGVGIAVCLLVVMIAPFVAVVGYETIGHRRQRDMLARLLAEDDR